MVLKSCRLGRVLQKEDCSQRKRMSKKDNATTVQELKDIIKRFVTERDWTQYHNPKNLSMSMAIEAAELMEKFQFV